MTGTPAPGLWERARGLRVAVTGASGFLGSSIVARLAHRGYTVSALSRRVTAAAPAAAGIEWHEVDLFDPRGIVTALAGCQAVVHCAGGIAGDLEQLRRLNVEGARSLALAARRASVKRCVQLSSLAVYAREGRDWIDEGCPLVSAGHAYNLTKAEGERAMVEAARGDLELVMLRPGAVMGVHASSFWGVHMPEAIRGQRLRLRGDGQDSIPWIQVEDLLEAVELSLVEPRAAGQAFNLVDEHSSWRSYSDTVRSWFGTPPLDTLALETLAPGEYWRGHFDARAIRALGYTPAHTLAEGLAVARRYWLQRNASQRARAGCAPC